MQTKHPERNLHHGLYATNREILPLLRLLGALLISWLPAAMVPKLAFFPSDHYPNARPSQS